MKRNSTFILAFAILAAVDGYLLAAISFVGRAGISVFYTQYQFLKTWWKGGLLVFIAWIFLFAIQSFLNKKINNAASRMMNIALLIIAIAGLYISYADFRNSLSHRWLGERFHLGVYLFWLGWMIISVFVLLPPYPSSNRQEDPFADKHLK